MLISPNGGGKLKRWFKGVYNAIKVSKRGDVIVCWFDFQAIMLYWLCRLTLRKREIFAINIMLKQKTTGKNKIVAELYKAAFKSKHFHASVTSTQYGEWLNYVLGTAADFSLIRDVVISKYYKDVPLSKNAVIDKGTVLCGGGNSRDWELMIRLSQSMPEVNFRFVMRGFDYVKYKDEFTDNVVIYHDIKHEEFSKILKKCEVLCLPLTTDAPSGLMVLFESAYHHKPIFMTKTVTSSTYVNEERGYPMSKDFQEWKRALEYGFAHRDEMQAKADKMFDFITKECSEDNFVKQLDAMIGKYVK